MSTKGVSAIKGISDIFHQRPAFTLNRKTAMPASSNANPAITVYLLQQQEKRFIKQRDSLKLRLIENERGLSAVSKELERLIKLHPSLFPPSLFPSSKSSKEKSELSGLKEKKVLKTIRLDY